MSDIFASPIHRFDELDPNNLDQMIEVFDEQVRGWVFRHASALADSGYSERTHAGFAILLLISSYFEAIEPYFVGEKVSSTKTVYRRGLQRAFPELQSFPDKVLDTLYGQLRCGLYHEAKAGSLVQICEGRSPFTLDVNGSDELVSALVDPWAIFERVQAHFASCIDQLKDPRELVLRDNFRKVRGLPSQVNVTFFGGGARSSYP